VLAEGLNRSRGIGCRIIDLQSRRHANVVAIALANKMARMAWVMMTSGVDYDPDLAAASVN